LSLAIAVLGCGRIAHTHATTIGKVGRDTELAFASRDPARAEEYRIRYKGFASYGSYEDALEDPRVNAVLVATPPAQHLPLVRSALGAGKHVVVEKPAFLNTRDFDAVEQLALAAGKQVLVAENYRYKPLTVCLVRLLAEDVVGGLRLIRLSALKLQRSTDWRQSAELAGGGALFEGGVHWVNLLTSLGGAVTSTQGFRTGSESLERTMVVVVKFGSGAIGTLHHSWAAPARWKGLSLSQIIGETGTIVFESNGLFVGVNGKRRRLRFPGFRDARGFGAMWRDFLNALATGGPPLMTLAHARRDMAVIEAAYRTGATS
jgi:predicted dehydrogenase